MLGSVKIGNFQKGIYFCDGKPQSLLETGKHFMLKPFKDDKIIIYSERDPWLTSDMLDMIVKSELAKEFLTVIDLKDNERALVWIDNRFDSILMPGLYALWNTVRKIKVEIVETEKVLFERKEMDAILKGKNAESSLEIFTVSEGHEGLFFLNGKLAERLEPGRYIFWKGVGQVKLYHKDLREVTVDISGQEIMTHDKVTLRINAVLNYRIKDAVKVVYASDDIAQTLYRDAQLALRAVVGTKELDHFLAAKDEVINELIALMSKRAQEIGIEIIGLGIRDIILPGEMKDLLNKVTEAKKLAEANLIFRREEVAAMRSQLNTAKLLADNPVLMRLKELEILEKVSSNSKLKVILGNEKLTEKVVNLI
jgi:hypothetical protein